MAAAVRRRQRERQPRVMLYDTAGAPRTLAPAEPGYDELLETAEAMIDLVTAGDDSTDEEPERRSRRGRRGRPERGR